MSKHDRNVLTARLLVSCGVLFGPALLAVALVVYALHVSEETRPWSHRSVACDTRDASRAGLDRGSPASQDA